MKSGFNKNFLSLISGTSIAQIIPILIAPILSRLYSPEDFGLYAFYIGIVGVLSVISTFKYEMAIIIPKNKLVVNQLLQISIFSSILISLVSFFLILMCFIFFNFDSIFLTIPISSFLLSIVTIYDRFFNRIKAYHKMSIHRIIKTSSESVYNLLGFINLMKSSNLIFGFIFGYVLSFIYILFYEVKNFGNILSKFSIKKIKWTILTYKNFPIFTLPHTFLNTISTNIPILLIPLYYDQSQLGLYTFGLKYIQAPLALISSSVYNVLGRDIAESIEDEAELLKKVYSVFKKIVIISLFISPFLIFAEPLFNFIFGNNWGQAGKFIQIQSFWILISFIVSAFGSIPIIFKKQKKALFIELLYSLAKVIPFVLFAGFFKMGLYKVLCIYTILTSIILIYSLLWYKKLISK
jgi:O-antigen/teichoic acid export membrane protein